MGQALRVFDGSPPIQPDLFGDMLDASAEGLALTTGGRSLHAHPALAELFGYAAPSELEGHLLSELLMNPGDHDCACLNRTDRARIGNGNPVCEFLYMSGYEPQNSAGEEPIVFFRKPFTGAALLGKVREILDAKRLTNSMKFETRKGELP